MQALPDFGIDVIVRTLSQNESPFALASFAPFPAGPFPIRVADRAGQYRFTVLPWLTTPAAKPRKLAGGRRQGDYDFFASSGVGPADASSNAASSSIVSPSVSRSSSFAGS